MDVNIFSKEPHLLETYMEGSAFPEASMDHQQTSLYSILSQTKPS